MRERITITLSSVRKCDKVSEFLRCGARVEDLARQKIPILQAPRLAPGNKRRSCIQTDNVPFWSLPPTKNLKSDRRILLRRPSSKLFDRDQRQSKIRRVQEVVRHYTSFGF